MNKPRVNSDGQKELDKAQEKIDSFQEQAREFNPFTGLTDIEESEPQTKMSTREARNADAIYIKPIRSIQRPNFKSDRCDSRVYWDEKYREDRDRDWEYVRCIVENNEIIGEEVEVWTAKWACDPAHFWKVPVNKPVMIPRMLAEQLSKCHYHRLKMEDNSEKMNYVNSKLVADHVVRRIDCRPVGFGF